MKFSTPASKPSVSSVSARNWPVRCLRSSTRSTASSPNRFGMIETRKSISRPSTTTWKRPSCGTRRSAMSSSDITLMREMAWCAISRLSICLTTSSTPSRRYLITIPLGCVSMWTSLAPVRRASYSVESTSRTTGLCVASICEIEIESAASGSLAAAGARVSRRRTPSIARTVFSAVTRNACRSAAVVSAISTTWRRSRSSIHWRRRASVGSTSTTVRPSSSGNRPTTQWRRWQSANETSSKSGRSRRSAAMSEPRRPK